MGYTQGLNFTAAVLSCAMARDDAFWCLTALAEAVASHFVSENMLQGAVADCECVLVCFLDMLLMEEILHQLIW